MVLFWILALLTLAIWHGQDADLHVQLDDLDEVERTALSVHVQKKKKKEEEHMKHTDHPYDEEFMVSRTCRDHRWWK